MGLFDFLKPKWQSRNPEVRLGAVQAMGAKDLGTLKALAAADADPRVRRAAVERIDQRGALEELIAGDLGADLREIVRAKLDRLLCEEALGGTEPAGLDAALTRIDDLGLIERLAAHGPSPAARLRAVERIADPEALCRVVQTNCGKEPARAALAKVDDVSLLERIARTGASKVTRRLAEEKLAALASKRAEPAERARRDRELERLAHEARGLAASEDWAAARTRLVALEQEWQGIDPKRGDPRWSALEGARERLEERRGEADRQSEEAARRADGPFTNGDAAAALAAVEALVGSLDGDVEERFRDARAAWDAAGGEADRSLAARFEGACERYRAAREAIEEERRCLAELSEELGRIEALRAPQDLERARRGLTNLERRAGGLALRHLNAAGLLSRLEAARSACDERLVAQAEAEARARHEALEKRAELCAALEGLLEAEDRAAAARRVKELRRDWRTLPASHEAEARALAERFAAAAKRFSARQAAFHEQLDWLRWNNKTLKEELCAAVEALTDEADLDAVASRTRQAQRRWRAIGAAPKADAEALWQRFKEACDAAMERCRPYLEEQERRRTEGIERREELCRQAELHRESTDWKESAEALKRLQAEWKEAGPISREGDHELYARFRAACDRFFVRRQAHLTELDESRRGNQAEKERLCERAEALAAAPDRARAREFRELQAAWKRAGPAPRNAEQPLWERFRASCDCYFAWLDAGRRENLHRKEALCAEVEAFMAGVAADADPQEVTAKIADLQTRWNEIGPVPKSEDDAVWERFHRPVDAFFEARRSDAATGTETASGTSS